MAEPIKGLGEGGLNTDQSPVNIPPNIFSDVLNVRFDDGCVQTITGETTYLTVPNAPNYGIHWRRPDAGYNIFARDGNILRSDSAGNFSTMFNSVSSEYTNSDWQGTLFNGGFAVILNNGKSTPLYCLYNDPAADHTFQPLPGWNYTSGLTVTAKVVRSINYSLVSANLTLNNGGIVTYAPGTIRISTQAATGSIPQIWMPGLTTDTADEFELSSTSPILDMLDLRGNLFVYSQDSINIISVGSSTRVQQYSKTYGILNTDCVVEYDGNHLVVDKNDIYIHNGSGSIESVADFRIKKYFFNNINKLKLNMVHVVKDIYHKEIWVCYPKGTSNYCNEALVYQYKNNTWTKRVLPNTTYAFKGPSIVDNTFQYIQENVYMTTSATQTLVTDNSHLMWNGVALSNYDSYIEHTKMSAGDVTGSNLVAAIFPVFDLCDDSIISIRVKGQNRYNDDVDLSVDDGNTTFYFDPNRDSIGYKVDPRSNGRLLNFRITSMGYWRLANITFDIRPADRR